MSLTHQPNAKSCEEQNIMKKKGLQNMRAGGSEWRIFSRDKNLFNLAYGYWMKKDLILSSLSLR